MGDKTIPYSEEEKLRESLQDYRQLIDSTPICIKVFDASGKLVFINKGGRKEHFIQPSDDISKWDWVGTVKPEYRKMVLDAFQAGLKGEFSRIEMEHTPEGSTHEWCEGIISPIKGSDGKVSLLLFYSIDITEKKMSEIELKKMNQLMLGRELDMVKLKEKIKELENKKV